MSSPWTITRSGPWRATKRVTRGLYRFDPTTFDALWKTPVTGDIPTEVLFHLPEWCVDVPTPDRRWPGAGLNRFFSHLDQDMNDGRKESRVVLDLSGPKGDHLDVLPLHLGQGGVAVGVAAILRESARQVQGSMHAPGGLIEELTDDLSPLVSLVLYLCSQAAEIKEGQGGANGCRTGLKP